jgi:hypothetical protein
MKPLIEAWANVSLQFNEPELRAGEAPPQDSPPRRWFWEAGLQFNARKDAVGGGFGLGAQYKFTDRFGLGLNLSFSGMSVDERKKSVPDFQWGAGLEPTYQVVGKPGKVTGSLILGELGLYHLVGHKTVDGYLAPIGLRLNIPLFGTSALSLSGKPQVHYDGEFKGGAAAALAWKGEF